MVFRVAEKLSSNGIIGNGWRQYMITVLIVLLGIILFSTVMKKMIGLAEKKF